jgi:Kef-type K+ transport system membrane component KefB
MLSAGMQELRPWLVSGWSPGGEVGLIIAGIGATSGIFAPDVFSAVVLMVVITTVLTPVPLKRLYQQPIKKV